MYPSFIFAFLRLASPSFTPAAIHFEAINAGAVSALVAAAERSPIVADDRALAAILRATEALSRSGLEKKKEGREKEGGREVLLEQAQSFAVGLKAMRESNENVDGRGLLVTLPLATGGATIRALLPLQGLLERTIASPDASPDVLESALVALAAMLACE